MFTTCRYFVRHSAEYEQFAREASKIFENWLTPSIAVDIILKHRREVLKLETKVSVFVFVDEFRMLYEVCARAKQYRKQDMSVLSSLGNLLSQSEKHTVMISTLDNTALTDNSSFDIALFVFGSHGILIVHLFVCLDLPSIGFRGITEMSTGSGRPNTYLPVRPLNGPEKFRNNPWMKHESVRRMVDEIGGHPRGLRCLRELLEKDYPIAKKPIPPVFEDLLKSMIRTLGFDSFTIVKTSPQLIAACLLGLTVQRSRQPSPSVGHTYADYIAPVRVR